MSIARKSIGYMGRYTHTEIASALAQLTPLDETWVETRALVKLNGALYHLPTDWNYGKVKAAAEMIGGELILVSVSISVANSEDENNDTE